MSDEEEERLNGREREREICYATNEDEDNDGDDEDEGMPGESKWKYMVDVSHLCSPLTCEESQTRKHRTKFVD